MTGLSSKIRSDECRSREIESGKHIFSEIGPSRHGSEKHGSGSDETRSGSGKVKENSYICAICDDGGRILCCDGKCMRSFHPTKEDGEMSNCATLGLTGEQMMLIEKEKFICKNCEYKQHQCFACGVLGSSDISSGAEVFQCNDISCGHFYHAQCLAGLYYPNKEDGAIVFQQKIARGQTFFCPMHRCSICERREKKKIEGMQFAFCRRCPTSYHQKCMPRSIVFQNSEGITQRAWNGLLPNGRILIFCMRHEMKNDLGTPSRDHIIFPDIVKKSKQSDAHENEIEHWVDEHINDGEEGGNPGLNRMVSSMYPTNKLTLKERPKIALMDEDSTFESNIPDREKVSVGMLNRKDMRQEKNENTNYQHDNMESSEVSGGDRNQRGSIMKPGILVGVGKNKSECNAEFSACDDADGIGELRPPLERKTYLEMSADCDPNFSFNCFAFRDMFLHPHPGSCGWLDA